MADTALHKHESSQLFYHATLIDDIWIIWTPIDQPFAPTDSSDKIYLVALTD